jgi:hypothetical protein
VCLGHADNRQNCILSKQRRIDKVMSEGSSNSAAGIGVGLSTVKLAADARGSYAWVRIVANEIVLSDKSLRNEVRLARTLPPICKEGKLPNSGA